MIIKVFCSLEAEATIRSLLQPSLLLLGTEFTIIPINTRIDYSKYPREPK